MWKSHCFATAEKLSATRSKTRDMTAFLLWGEWSAGELVQRKRKHR
jgi:hypothetical protein